MSPESNGGGGDSGAGRSYGFPSARSNDRHIQNIIDHTDAMFSAPPQRTPQFTYGGIWPGDHNNAVPSYFNNLLARDDVMSDFPQLDEFGMCASTSWCMSTCPTDAFVSPDLQILGRRPSDPPPEHHFGRPSAEPPRISFPNVNVSSSSNRRVIGDASHHFRPFVSHGDNYRPQFLSNPLQTQPSPSTQPIFGRDGSHRVASLQPSTQLATPPFYSGMSYESTVILASLTISKPLHSPHEHRRSSKNTAPRHLNLGNQARLLA